MKIQAAISRAKGQISFETVDISDPQYGEVLIKVLASGICHTDEVILNQELPVPVPIVLGHEGVGIVEAVGEGCTQLRVGDRVIMTFPSCGDCPECMKGHPYACKETFNLFYNGASKDGSEKMRQGDEHLSILFGSGSFASYTLVDERNAVKIDERINLDEIKNLCSLGCGVQTGAGAVINRMKPRPGSSIAIYGCGAVGMGAIMAASIIGCSKIIAIDINEERLNLAKTIGATHTVYNNKSTDLAEEIKKITNGNGVNFALEAVGKIELVNPMLKALSVGGLAVVVGMMGDVTIPIKTSSMQHNITIAWLLQGESNPQIFIPELIELYRLGKFPLDKICKYYKLNEIQKAFADSRSGEAIKPILCFN